MNYTESNNKLAQATANNLKTSHLLVQFVF